MAGVLKVEGPGPTLNRIQLDRRPQTVDKHGEISTVLGKGQRDQWNSIPPEW